MKNYKKVKLGDVATFKYGSYIRSADTSINGAYPVYSGYRITGYLNDYIYNEPQLLVVARGVGGTGEVKISPPKCTITNLSIIVQLDPNEVERKYLFYKFQNHNLRYLDSGSAQSQITIQDLSNLEISLPPLPEQKRIANILSSFDEKIDLLKKENKTLEDIAQNIFKEWFVKYNFPNKDGKPYKDNGGKMIDSELGEIPEGWRVDHIGKYINIKGGSTPSTKVSEFWNGDLNWTTPKDLSNLDGLFLFNSGTKITQRGLKQVSSGLLPKGTLLLSSRAPIGYLAFVQVNTAINQGFIAFLPDAYISNMYMYLWLKHNMKLIEAIANGSTFMEINKENLRNFEMIIPEKNSLQNFNLKTTEIFKKISENEYGVSKLKEVKTALLNKLIKA